MQIDQSHYQESQILQKQRTKIHFLQNHNQILKTRIQILEEQIQHQHNLIRQLGQLKGDSIMNPQIPINQSFQKQKQLINTLLQKNSKLSSQLLLNQQCFNQEIKFYKQIIAQYEQAILELRVRCNEKQFYIQVNEKHNHLMDYNQEYKCVKLDKQSFMYIEQKNQIKNLVFKLEGQLEKWKIMNSQDRNQRLSDTKNMTLSKSRKLSEDDNIDSSKSLTTHINNFTLYGDKTNDKTYFNLSSLRGFVGKQQQVRFSRSSLSCMECQNLKTQLKMTCLKLEQMLRFYMSCKKQNTHLKIKQNILKNQYISLQEIINNTNKQNILQNSENKQNITPNNKIHNLKKKNIKSTFKQQQNQNEKIDNIFANQDDKIDFNEISAIGQKLMKSNNKNYMPEAFIDLEIFQ